jgi:hypothetical protein
MRMGWVPVAMAALMTAPAAAADREFGAVVAGIEQRYGLHHERIPFLGFASFCARVASVGAVRGMEIAEFEDVGPALTESSLDAALQGELGASWHRFVSTWERESGETTVIYSRERDGKFFLMIASLDGGSLSLVKLAMSKKEMVAFARGEEWVRKRGH